MTSSVARTMTLHATEVAGRADELIAYIRGARRSVTDWALVGLTWLALVTNVWLLFLEPHRHAWREGVQIADTAIAALLLLAICWRWLRFRIGRIYLTRRPWEIPALFPFLVPTVGEWHWVLWIVLLCRVARMVDRTDNVVGDRITAALVEHFSGPIVEAIKRPITVAVLDEVIDVIKEGTYAANLKAALDENRAELEAMVLDLVRQDQTTGKLRYLPFHDDIVRLVADTVLRITDGALSDPRTTELISDVIRNSADQLRHALRTQR
jgi:voltage-gated potassium channel